MRQLLSLNQRFWPVPVLLLLAIVTAGSLDPTQPLPHVLTWDKARHFLAYGALALPIALARPRHWGFMLLALLAWSIGIELIQPYVGRSRDIRDFLANATGVGMALLCSEILRRLARLLSPRVPFAE
jgi:VanZ family protein